MTIMGGKALHFTSLFLCNVSWSLRGSNMSHSNPVTLPAQWKGKGLSLEKSGSYPSR